MMICLRERERENASTGRESEKKNRRGMRFVPHDEQRTTPLFFSLSIYILYVARSSIAFCIASLLPHTNMHGANLGEYKKRGVQTYEKKNHCLSCINKQYTIADTVFFLLIIYFFFCFFVFFFFLPDFSYSYIFACLKKTGNNLSPSFSSYTHHIICYPLRYTCD